MAALFVVGAVIDLSRAAGNGTVKRVVEVRQGTTLRRVALELEEAGVINSALLMTYYGRLTGNASRLQAGTYQFSNNMSPRIILGKLVAGEVMTITFTVPEGYNIYQVAELLERQGLFKRQPFLERCADRKLLRSLGIRAATVEGYLYPSTYQLTMDMDEADLIRLMVRTFFQGYSDDFARQAKGRHLTMHQVLTLASIIEKEAVVPFERPLIASVFVNRLRRGMKLQSDPTAVYGQGAFGVKVHRRDVRNSSPYNTYKIEGLPPGPIGNPSKEAIEAVLNPARTNYLYFVARRDGTHQFSATLTEHNDAVRRYLKGGSQRRRPSS